MTVFQFIGAVIRLCFYTLLYLRPIDPEYINLMKARAWCDLGAYAAAIRCYEKALQHIEQVFVRAEMAWCYLQLGMAERSLDHYRRAYSQVKHPWIALAMAEVELDLGQLREVRLTLEFTRSRSDRLRPDQMPLLERLEQELAQAELADGVAAPSMHSEQDQHQPMRDQFVQRQ